MTVRFSTQQKSYTATGGSAVDLMKNIPSVSVDIDGNVTLRNSQPQIFVDGRPTILTLDQIPAENIDKVELITNPSAKFDAASSGGIINIILKKNKRVGLNGIFTAGVGHPRIANSNLNLNLRQGKLNFFLSAGINMSGGRARSETYRENKTNGAIDNYFNQDSYNDRRRRFINGRFGFDYFVDNRNTFTLTQQLGRGRFSYDEEQNQVYLNNGKVMEYYGERFSDGKTNFRRNGTTLNYKHTFPKNGQELTADVTYNYGGRDEKSVIENRFYLPDGSPQGQGSLVRNAGDEKNNQVTAQVDYVNPITEKSKIEMGLRTFRNYNRSRYDAFSYLTSVPEKLPLSNNYEYTERIHAAYVTYSNKIETIGYQLGIRSELSEFDGLLIDSAYNFGYKYPAKIKNIWDALFPSLFLTKELSEKDQLQANYSRRIRRPRFWQINPFIEINDPTNLRQGNPALRPEFVNSFEVNYSHNYKKGNFLAVLYFRNNPGDITQYSDTITTAQYALLQNAAIDPNAILNTFINAGVTNRYGAEFTLQHKEGDNFEITPTATLQYRTVKAKVDDLDLSNEGFNWQAKLMTNYKLAAPKSSFFNKMAFQLMGEYRSGRIIPQGREKDQYSVDFAVRKDFLKNDKATLTLGVNDVFNSNRWGTIYDTDNFYQDSYRRWSVRSIRLTFSYKFGDAEFSFGNKNRERDNSDM
ncbi:MAG: TonB-dependent receptor [Chitinophagaceae bacterium]|nr:TonB-dependent receptor [Chitinophagaceae bacterium]